MSKTIYVFKDNDGDYLVANSDVLTDGTKAWQLGGAVDSQGGPIDFLLTQPAIIVMIKLTILNDIPDGETVEEQASRLGSALAYTREVDDDSSLATILYS